MSENLDRKLDTNGAPAPGRRRLLTGGLAAAPVALTLASRPVSACYTTKPSAFCSVGGSRAHVAPHSSACSPTYWAGCANTSWPSTCKDANGSTLKCSVLWGSGCLSGVTGYDSNGFQYTCGDATTLKKLCQLTGTSWQLQLAQSCAAAHVNACAGYTTGIIGTAECRNMYLACRAGGYYEPSAGVKWYATSTSPITAHPSDKLPGVIGYLKSTWGIVA
jgi:hypothetical protein